MEGRVIARIPVTLIVISFAQPVQVQQVAVAGFQMSGQFSNMTYMRHRHKFTTELTNLTQCMHLRLARLRGVQTVFLNYATDEEPDMLKSALVVDRQGVLSMDICRLKYSNGECNEIDADGAIEPMEWMHLCTTFEVWEEDGYGGNWEARTTTYRDGEIIKMVESTISREDFQKVDPGGVLILGQDQDSPGEDFDPNQAFSGELSQVGIWDKILTLDEIKKMANCELNLLGNQVIWDINVWEVNEVNIEYRDLNTMCQPDLKIRKFVISKKISYNMMKKTCDDLKGVLPTPFTKEELIKSNKDFKDTLLAMPGHFESDCDRDGEFAYNLGQQLTDLIGKAEKVWQDPYVSWRNWPEHDNDSVPFFPEKVHEERCLYSAGLDIVPQHCHIGKVCGICYLDHNAIVKLKGMCVDPELKEEQIEPFDTDYYVYGQVNGRPHFVGKRNSHIYYNKEINRWTLQSLRHPHKNATMENAEVLPMGTHLWEPDMCDPDITSPRELTLSRCFPNMYTCNDGTCIPLSFRCDTEIDCQDKSDELNCTYITLGPDYAKELMPRDRKTREPVKVYMNVSILALPYIDTQQLKFTADFYLNLRWYDVRVGLRDLNMINLLNTLSQEDVAKIWKPQLVFTNALGPYQTVYDAQVSAIVLRESDDLKEDFSMSTEAMLFSSGHNSISLSREYFLDYRCNYDLQYYPFDTQMCKMVFTVQGKTDNYIMLQKDGSGVEFLDGRMLVEYEIQKEVMEIKILDHVSVAEVKIVFRRRMEYHLYNTLTQTLILVFVGYMSYYFDLDDFNDRIMVTLTTMLVIATTTAAIQSDLPKTATFKMIDMWLFFASNVLVITMAFHTYLAFIVERAKKKMDGRYFGSTLFRIPKLLKKKKKTTPGEVSDSSIVSSETIKVATANGNDLKGQMHDISEEEPKLDKDAQLRASRFNDFAKVVYLVVVIGFNIVFWTVAMREYMRPPEEYLEDGVFTEEATPLPIKNRTKVGFP